MNASDIIKALATRQAGGALSIVVNRPAKVLKALAGEAGEIRKVSRYSLQLASYARRQPVREAVESGEREAPKLPAWVERSEKLGNGLNFWIGKNRKQYLALPVFGDKGSARVEWLRDGRPVEKIEIARFLLASELADHPSKSETEEKGQAQFNAITLENIAEIN